MKTTCVKAFLLCLSLSFLLISLVPNKFYAQTCITDDADMMNPWPVIVNDGNASNYVKITKSGGSNDARDWLKAHFSVDVWINCNYDWFQPGTNLYSSVIWKSSDFIVEKKNIHLYLFKLSDLLLLIVGDNLAEGGFDDVSYVIEEDEYYNDWAYKWQHLTVTHDGNEIKLYINGTQPSGGSASDWNLQSLVSTYLIIGSTGIPNTGFRGSISGFRLWTTDLSEDQIKYIKDKSFFDETSFDDTHSGLYEKLVVNMVTTEDDFLTINGGHEDAVNGWVTLTEYGTGLSRSEDLFHPQGPFPPGELSVVRECNSIELNWRDFSKESTGYGATHEVWRNRDSDSATLLCTTNDTFYVDSDELEPGTSYTYTIKSKWLQPEWWVLFPRTMYYSHDPIEITSTIKTLPIPEDFSLTDDQCDGTIELSWQPVTSASGYAIRYKVDGGDWNPLVEPSTTSYTHTVDPAEQGRI
ncbi:MAG: hypothetical protein AMS27_12395, partial [Bacteroides sp. SM23_62_1]